MSLHLYPGGRIAASQKSTADATLGFYVFHLHSFRYVIARTLDLSKERRVGFLQSDPIWRTVYLPFAKQLLQHRDEVAVLSVNYSLVLDQALLQVGVEPTYYLPGKMAWPNDDQRPRQSIDLFKPHGSINWLVPVEKGRREDVVVDLHIGLIRKERAGNWQTSEKTPHPHDNGCLLKPLIAPPSYEAFAPKKVDFQWDWDGMREPSTIPLWEDFLKI